MTDAHVLETGTEQLAARVERGVATLTMCRPEARNALTVEMLVGLERALDAAERADDVGCVVLTGGGGAFCAGGDVKAMAASESPRRDEARRRGDTPRRPPSLDARVVAQRRQQRATAGRLYAMPKPTVAALSGAAAGAGLALALACDLRIAASDAVLVTAFAQVGLSGDFGGTYFMTHILGAAKTKELYLLSERVDAMHAERLGLVSRVVPTASLAAEAQSLGERLASGPRVAYRYMKENIHRAAAGCDPGVAMDLEATHHLHTTLTEDHAEAARAFVEKRAPVFRGR
jgi:2-(1,2-epoxy-1,2-dihydrophenyl)acetyl-CoA isomerase